MAGTTIATKTKIAVRLTAASQLPLMVTATGAINVTSGNAVYVAAPLAGAITNVGVIKTLAGDGVQALGAVSVVNGGTAATKALIEGSSAGIDISGAAAVTNYGTVAATATASTPSFASVGAYLGDGGRVTNGSAGDKKALISGGSVGIAAVGAAATLTNFGSVKATGTAGVGVWLADGGKVVNGSAADKTATISGNYSAVYSAAAATVTNFGTLAATKLQAVYLKGGGTVVNGAVTDTTASMTGNYNAIRATMAITVTNFGTLRNVNSAHSAVVLLAGGTVINGSAKIKSATIVGASGGIYAKGGAASVTKFGTLTGTEFQAVALTAGGIIVNGALTDTTASMTGNYNAIFAAAAAAPTTVTNFGTLSSAVHGAVQLDDSGTVVNYGTITTSSTHSTVVLLGGGTVVNGSSADTAALITSANGKGIYASTSAIGVTNYGTIVGSTGVVGEGAAITVSNLGTVTATKFQGVYLGAGGTVINGSSSDAVATINGGVNDQNGAATTVTNFGTIIGTAYNGVFFGAGGTSEALANFGAIAATTYSGVFLGSGGTVTNGSTANTNATIGGQYVGVLGTAGSTTVTNFGTIKGVHSGVFFVGSAAGTVVNAGIIENAGSASGTAILFESSNDRLVVDPGAVFIGLVNSYFAGNVLELAAGTKAGSIGGIGSQFNGFSLHEDLGATWTMTGADSVGTFTDDGALTVAGSLDVYTSLDPASTGTIDLGATATLEVASVLGKGPAIAFLTSDKLIVDTAADFGLHVGKPTYIGPLLEHFVAGDAIDLTNVADSGLVLNYATAAGLLTISNGGGALASLLFQNSSLGAGTWHTGTDGGTGTLLTHS